MKPAHWAMLGLCLDILGAFLLAVEAIKLENLRSLRVKFLLRLHRAMMPPPIAFIDKERDGEAIRIEESQPTSASGRTTITLKASRFRISGSLFIGFYFVLHLAAGAIVILLANALFNGIIHTGIGFAMDTLAHLTLWVSIPLLLFALWVGLACVWMLGELVHTALIRCSGALIQALLFIEGETASGVVGILGFAVMFLGFLFQMYANHVELLGPPH